LGVVATSAALDVASANRLAALAHDGLALAIRPAHTQFDGDTIFALSLPAADAPATDMVALAAAAVDVVAESVLRAVRAARGLHGIPGLGDAPAPR
jgi:L-aminopeptidase/D-esterase-like protein